jgi:hypothetical protein
VSKDLISLTISVTGLLASIITLAFLVVQLRLLREQINQAKDAYISEQHRMRKQSTLEFVASTLDRRIGFLEEIPSVKDPEATKNFIRQLPTDPAASKSIFAFLNYQEYVASGVNEGILDIDVIDRMAGTTIMKTQEGYGDFIAKKRESDNHPTLYAELQKLAKLIHKRRSLQT